ncbi:hypothetical protein PMI06_007614 [Burkholderia sp. BT03]|nr:hypothetical protein PMI06_007614 [Burkholderia sp. BT03]SKC92734.1 hypothetical protein SAMN06266956_5234 [Paraburkholderia hospita]
MLAVLAAFFCLLFFAAAKKSRCRPAQGRRVNGKHRNADANENTSKPPSVADNKKTLKLLRHRQIKNPDPLPGLAFGPHR